MKDDVAPRSASDIARFVCRDDDGLWVGIERAIDNGYGAVFTTDSAGILTGIVHLDQLRAAVRKGAHLGSIRLGEIAVKWDSTGKPAALTPILDGQNRIIDIEVRPESTFLPVAEPDLTHIELRNVVDAFLSTWISSIGDYVRSFERNFASKVGMAHGVATSNGTVSLQLALAALGIGEGDEVIVPDFTFAASASTVIHAGARPVLVDVDPDTWCVSAETIERALTHRTRAVVPVHVFGRPAPMTEIAALAKARGLFVIEDCAEAHGARYDGRPVGSFSDVASFSFYGNKIITTGEGGICLTNDAALADRMRMLRDHGMRPERRYWHEEPGFNFRMTNLQASIGCAQLERMDELIAMRERVHKTYETAFVDVPGVRFPRPLPSRYEPVVWFSSILTPADKRDALIAACRAANIDLRPFFHSLSSMPAFSQHKSQCPVSAQLSLSGVNLPTLRKVDARIATKIADIFRSLFVQ
jgi:perosamine synthetase